MIFSQKVIKQLRGGPSDRGHYVHEGLNGRGHPRADRQTVSHANRLRNNFTEDDCYLSEGRPINVIQEHKPIRTVEPRTAGHPPPSERSSTIGKVSLVMTLLKSRVTKTQCFPFWSNFRTFAAWIFSAPSPESRITCR